MLFSFLPQLGSLSWFKGGPLKSVGRHCISSGCFWRWINVVCLFLFQSDGNTAFLRAARAGHLDKVLEHLKSNVDINTANAVSITNFPSLLEHLKVRFPNVLSFGWKWFLNSNMYFFSLKLEISVALSINKTVDYWKKSWKFEKTVALLRTERGLKNGATPVLLHYSSFTILQRFSKKWLKKNVWSKNFVRDNLFLACSKILIY